MARSGKIKDPTLKYYYCWIYCEDKDLRKGENKNEN